MLDRYREAGTVAGLSTLLPPILMAVNLPSLDRIAGTPFIAKIGLPEPTPQAGSEGKFAAANRAKSTTAPGAGTAEGENSNGGDIATVQVDRILRQTDDVRLRQVAFPYAYKTASHIRCAPLWSWSTAENGETYKIFRVGSQKVVARTVDNTWQRLLRPTPNIWSEHTCQFDRIPKHAAIKKSDSNAFVDPVVHRLRAQELR